MEEGKRCNAYLTGGHLWDVMTKGSVATVRWSFKGSWSWYGCAAGMVWEVGGSV